MSVDIDGKPQGSYISDEDFKRVSSFIYKNYGIKLPPTKKILLEGRLAKRLRHYKMSTYSEYFDFLFSDEGFDKEIISMIDVVTTNKTDFFREAHHFDFLKQEIEGTKPKDLKVWSAASSSGEEPYTISIVLSEYRTKDPLFDYKLYASDISTIVLKKAVEAVYPLDRIDVIPIDLKRKYFLKSKSSATPTVRVVPALRNKIEWGRVNLMLEEYSTPYEQFDVIFCRNVLIYFDRPTQEKVLQKLCKKLKPNGILFIGHSESTNNMNLPLKTVKPTIYRKIS